MRYLKIKDNVSKKDIEKHLVYKTFIIEDEDDNGYECEKEISAWCCVDKYDDIQFYFNEKGKIDYTKYPECRSEGVIICKIYDLTKDDIVEVVEE